MSMALDFIGVYAHERFGEWIKSSMRTYKRKGLDRLKPASACPRSNLAAISFTAFEEPRPLLLCFQLVGWAELRPELDAGEFETH